MTKQALGCSPWTSTPGQFPHNWYVDTTDKSGRSQLVRLDAQERNWIDLASLMREATSRATPKPTGDGLVYRPEDRRAIVELSERTTFNTGGEQQDMPGPKTYESKAIRADAVIAAGQALGLDVTREDFKRPRTGGSSSGGQAPAPPAPPSAASSSSVHPPGRQASYRSGAMAEAGISVCGYCGGEHAESTCYWHPRAVERRETAPRHQRQERDWVWSARWGWYQV